ncbi:MAG: undecaprenyl-diphosphate phosphatase [Verrucomicrobia bacterium]|nr:undecaprenyl-diphosphate phosphatase [Verrucomicrobiota bacterium]
MPDWIAVILLGIVEGVTEFLPVSSTGHLLIAERWMPRQSDLFNVVIQCGAVLAVLVVFSRRVKQLALEWRQPEARDYLLKLAAAFVITGVGGVLLKKAGLKLPKEVAPIAWATLVGGVFFVVVERWLRGRATRDDITWAVALTIGAAQLLAVVFPGASRSGTTILAALVLGLSRPAATEFSFILGIPTLLAAGGLEIVSELRHHGTGGENWALLALGTAVAAVTAFLAVKWLLRYIQSHTFTAFGWYRIGVGVLILLLAW